MPVSADFGLTSSSPALLSDASPISYCGLRGRSRIIIAVLKYSIVVPLHNEQENVTDLYARLKSVMEASGETFEMVLGDDGSIDGTFALLRGIAAVDSRVTVVKLRRNIGHTADLTADFDYASGQYIST